MGISIIGESISRLLAFRIVACISCSPHRPLSLGPKNKKESLPTPTGVHALVVSLHVSLGTNTVRKGSSEEDYFLTAYNLVGVSDEENFTSKNIVSAGGFSFSYIWHKK
jgi:hypothetical protein